MTPIHQPEDTKTRLLREFEEKWVLRLPHPTTKSGTEVVADGKLFKDWLSAALDTVAREAREAERVRVKELLEKDSYYMKVGGMMVKVVSVEVVKEGLQPEETKE